MVTFLVRSESGDGRSYNTRQRLGRNALCESSFRPKVIRYNGTKQSVRVRKSRSGSTDCRRYVIAVAHFDLSASQKSTSSIKLFTVRPWCRNQLGITGHERDPLTKKSSLSLSLSLSLCVCVCVCVPSSLHCDMAVRTPVAFVWICSTKPPD